MRSSENKEVAAGLHVDQGTVGKWRRRFVERRIDGLRDEPRSGTPRTIDDARIEGVVVKDPGELARGRYPLEFARHGEGQLDIGLKRAADLARPLDCSRIGWRTSSSRPIRTSWPRSATLSVCISRRLNMPSCCAWTSQALDRSQQMLPMRPGQPARRSHDYTRHGTTSLFAALDIATGKVIGKCYGRHRAAEFRKFLDEIEAAVPRDLAVHLVMDNYATHKTPMRSNSPRSSSDNLLMHTSYAR